VKENQEKDKIGSKPDKKGKRGEAGKSLKQLQWVKDKQEKDKSETKPDKNGKREKARQCQISVTIKKAEKRRKYKFKGPNTLTLEDLRWPPRVTLGRLLPHARGLGFKPHRGGFPSGAEKEWGLSSKAKVRVLHTAQLDVTYIYGLALQMCAMVATTEPTTIQSDALKVGILTDEAIKNGALTEKRGNNGDPSRDGNVRDDNKRSRTRRAFATITNPVRKEYT
nr:hypothetical protein [Tanacetum cinerariifolium]